MTDCKYCDNDAERFIHVRIGEVAVCNQLDCWLVFMSEWSTEIEEEKHSFQIEKI